MQINMDKLPDSYILKTTHGGGEDHYEIVKDNKNADHEKIREKMQRALGVSIAVKNLEYHYKGIIPRVICDELIQPRKQERVDYIKDEYKIGHFIEKPEKLGEMLHAAEILSKNLPMSTIDLFYADGKVYFGEITIPGSGGCDIYITEYGQKCLGEMIELP